MVALLGRNGTGKSTLLRSIAALGELRSGDIRVDGRSLAEYSSAELARRIAFVNTERVDVEALSVYDLVAIGRSPYTGWSGRLTAEDRGIVERAMSIAGVGPYVNATCNPVHFLRPPDTFLKFSNFLQFHLPP